MPAPRPGLRRAARLLARGWSFRLKMASRSAFDGFLAVLWPLFWATTAFLMFRAGSGPHSLLYASLGSSVMGIWTAQSVAAGSALQRERWHGTLEILVAAPAHLSLILLPITIAFSTVGIYCMGATLLWGRLLFGIEVHIAHPLAFTLAVAGTVLSIGMLGFLSAVAFARYRTSWAIAAALELPVWLVCGFLVPIAALPGWVRPISWALAPTWGMRAIRESALGGPVYPSLAACLGLGVACAAIGVLLTNRVLRAARTRGTLSLT